MSNKNQNGNRNSDPILASGIGTRISAVSDLFGSRKNAAAAADVSTDSLQRYIREEVQPPFEAMAKMAHAANISLDWLATGEGPMQSGDTSKDTLNGEFDLVSLYDVQVSAGHGSHIEDEKVLSQIAFRHDWLKQNGFNIKSLVSVNAKGDSMIPTINDGDMLLIDRSQKEVVEDGVYVLRVDNHLLAKRLQRLFDGTIYIKSDNPAYERQEVSKDAVGQLQVIGRVVWSGRRM